MRLFLAFPLSLSLSLSLRRGITLRSNNKMCCVVNVLINTEHTKSIARFILFSHIFCGPPRERKIAATWRPRKETQEKNGTKEEKTTRKKRKKRQKKQTNSAIRHTLVIKKKRAAQRDTKEKHRQQRWGLLPRARTCHR